MCRVGVGYAQRVWAPRLELQTKRPCHEAGGGLRNSGPPAAAQCAMSNITVSETIHPSQTVQAPALRPSRDGPTTITSARSHGPRHSLVRTRAMPSACSRNCASRASWSTPGCFFSVPQQHPRQTVMLGQVWMGSHGAQKSSLPPLRWRTCIVVRRGGSRDATGVWGDGALTVMTLSSRARSRRSRPVRGVTSGRAVDVRRRHQHGVSLPTRHRTTAPDGRSALAGLRTRGHRH